MTDNDIIKALECCINDDCEDCPLYGENAPDVYGNCVQNTKRNALDLINRQKAEIERLKDENRILTQRRANLFEIVNAYEKGRAEAIKEFAERLKKVKVYSLERHESVVPVAQIDWVGQWFIKEMTEGE